MTGFQAALLGIFGVAIIAGVVFFGLIKGNGGDTIANVTVWGTVSEAEFNNFILDVGGATESQISVSYQEKDPVLFEKNFVEALAEGSGPDIILLPQDSILENKSRLYTVPFDLYKLRDFKDTFVEEGELFTNSAGIIGLPFSIDPLVMYWNRDLLSASGISTVPKYWDEFLQIVPKLTHKDSALNISQSAVALGEYRNIAHAKDILSALIIQAGNPIVALKEGLYRSVLVEKVGYSVAPAEAALNFFTEFSNPSKELYSWNRSLPLSTERFISGDLAFYFGYASELPTIREKNPNLNFDVSYFPTPRQNQQTNFTHGNMLAFSIVKNSPKISSAWKTIQVLTSKPVLALWRDRTLLPSVRRDLLTETPSNAYMEVFNTASVRARSWLDPSTIRTSKIFQDMVESVVSGRLRTSDAVHNADEEMDSFFK